MASGLLLEVLEAARGFRTAASRPATARGQPEAQGAHVLMLDLSEAARGFSTCCFNR